MSKPKFKIGDLVKIEALSWEPEEIGILIRKLNWREVIEYVNDKNDALWKIHIPSIDKVKTYSEEWLALISNENEIN